MLYVIQTESGKESDVVTEIRKKTDKTICKKVFTIVYEEILRRTGTYYIREKILFPSYIFVETDSPDLLFLELKKVINLSVLLSDKEKSGFTFRHISGVEEEMLMKLINQNEDYKVTLSMVVYNHKKRISNASEPLKYFIRNITEVDNRHKRAFVEIEFLGMTRRLAFGIITKDDGVVYEGRTRLEEELYSYSNSGGDMNSGSIEAGSKVLWSEERHEVKDYNDALINVGDEVIINDELYGDKPLRVISINAKKNTVTVQAEMFGRSMKVEMDAGRVIRV